MTVIIPPGYVQAQYRWSSTTFVTGGAATTFGLSWENEPPLPDLVDSLRQAWDLFLRPRQDSNIALAGVSVMTETIRHDGPGGGSGSNPGTLAPPNVTAMTSHGTTARGPRGRGRAYWPGFAYESEIDENGNFGQQFWSDLNDSFTLWFQELNALGTPLVVLQHEEGKTPPLSPPPVVTSFSLSPRVATQRRRLRR